MKIVPLVLGVSTSLVAIAGIAICLPNMMWLKYSTLRINNEGNQSLPVAQIQIGDSLLEVKDIKPGKFDFRILPQASEGTLAITLPPSHSLESLCHTYLEKRMYHVDVTVKNGQVLRCESSLPLLSQFWMTKAFL